MPLIVGPLVLIGLAATILLAWRFDTRRLLSRDFPGDDTFQGRLYRSRIYAGGEASTLSDVGADTRGIYLQPPKDPPRGIHNFFWNSSGLYVLRKAIFIPWDSLVYRNSRLPFNKQVVFKTPANGAMFLLPREVAMRLFADASREFRPGVTQ
jgi:hypothetical protein